MTRRGFPRCPRGHRIETVWLDSQLAHCYECNRSYRAAECHWLIDGKPTPVDVIREGDLLYEFPPPRR